MNIEIKKPKGWRNGQTFFNLLAWLQKEKGYRSVESYRMADPFYIEDDKLEELYKEYLEYIK